VTCRHVESVTFTYVNMLMISRSALVVGTFVIKDKDAKDASSLPVVQSPSAETPVRQPSPATRRAVVFSAKQ
jgi:hypothetical protein